MATTKLGTILMEQNIERYLITEDVVTILTNMLDGISSNHLVGADVDTGLDVLALLRVYFHALKNDDGSLFALNRITGNVTDEQALNTLKTLLKSYPVVAGERKIVKSMYDQGKRDGFKELKDQVTAVLDRLKPSRGGRVAQ
jgi:hypothetical protein